MKKRELVSMRAYAKSRGLSPSTISREAQSGAIRLIGGKIDPTAADRDRATRLDPAKRREKPIQAPSTDAAELPSPEVHDGGVRLLLQVTAPSVVLEFCRIARRAGASPRLAYILAAIYSSLPWLIPQDVDEPDVDLQVDPQLEDWEAVVGAKFDFKAADFEIDRFIRKFVAKWVSAELGNGGLILSPQFPSSGVGSTAGGTAPASRRHNRLGGLWEPPCRHLPKRSHEKMFTDFFKNLASRRGRRAFPVDDHAPGRFRRFMDEPKCC